MYNTGKELLEKCNELSLPISQIVLMDEIHNTESSEEAVICKMKEILDIMKNSITYCIENDVKTMGGIIGGEAKKLDLYIKNKSPLCGSSITTAMMRALSCSQYNASMGKICAAPTAGSSGIIPASIITSGEVLNCSEDQIIGGLLVCSGIGKIITQNATVSGAEGGCQAECGSAAAMAAAGIVEMSGGTPEMCLTAAAIALKNIMGLICDPIAGLVESPCSKRNSSGAVNAMTSADLALAKIESVVSFDEAVEAMYNVGKAMHPNFRETSRGGIAITETGKKISATIKGS